MSIDWNAEVRAQLESHWARTLRPRLDGLTDDEYFWEPAPGAWNVRSADDAGRFVADFAVPPPDPPPVTIIAWRIGHLVVVVHGMLATPRFGGPAVDFASFPYAGTADDAIRQFEDAYEAWIDAVRTLGTDGLSEPADAPGWSTAGLVLHVHREFIHHGAEISLLRDLYRQR